MKLQVVTAFFVALSVVSFGISIPKKVSNHVHSVPPVIDQHGNDIVTTGDRKIAPAENIISLVEEQVKIGKITLEAKEKEAALESLKTIRIYTESLKDCKEIPLLKNAILRLFTDLHSGRNVQAQFLDVLAALEVKAVKEEKAAAFNTTIAKIEIAKFFKLLKVDPKVVGDRSKETLEVIKQIEKSDAVCLGKIKEDGITIPEGIKIPESPAIQQAAATPALDQAIQTRIAQLQEQLKKLAADAEEKNKLYEQQKQELERKAAEDAKRQKDTIDALFADQNKKNDDLIKRLEEQSQKEKDKEKDPQPETKPTPAPSVTPGVSNEAPKMEKPEQPYNDPRNQQQGPMGPMMLPATPSQVQSAPPTVLAPTSDADREARRAQRQRDDLRDSKAQNEVSTWLNNLMLQNQIAQQQMMMQQQQMGRGNRFGVQSGRFGGAQNMLGGGMAFGGQTRGSRFGNGFGGGIPQMGNFAPTF